MNVVLLGLDGFLLTVMLTTFETDQERARRIGEKYKEAGGTPTPSPEWKKSEEILRNSLVKFGYSNELVDNTRFMWSVLGSAGLIDGEAIGRPDIILTSTARHTVLREDGASQFQNKTLAMANMIKGIYCMVPRDKFVVVPSSYIDAALIAFKKENALADANFFEGLITKVEDRWPQPDSVIVGGYNPSFQEGVGQDIPAITYAKNEYFKDNFVSEVYQFSGEGQAPGSSGGPVLDKNGHLVGIQIAGSPLLPIFLQDVLYITPFSDFEELSEIAVSELG